MIKILVFTLVLLISVSPVAAQDPHSSSKQLTVIFVGDGTSSLNYPSPYDGITRKQLLVAQLGPIFKTLRNQKEVRLIVLRLCGGCNLLYEGGVSQSNLGEIKIAAGLVPCTSSDGTNLVASFKTIKGIVDGQPWNEYAIICCSDGLHEMRAATQDDAYKALKQLGKQLKGHSIKLFAMLGIDESVRLEWRTAALQAFGSSVPVYVSGFTDLISTMKEVRSTLAK